MISSFRRFLLRRCSNHKVVRTKPLFRFISSHDDKTWQSATNESSSTQLLRSFQKLIEDSRYHPSKPSDHQRDNITFVTRQYTELPALLSQIHDICQRREIIHFLANESFESEISAPPYSNLIDRFLETATADALRFLLASRADMQTYLAFLKRSQSNNDSDFYTLQERITRLDQHWRRVLNMWFSPSVLLAQRIRYDQTPAAVIERIVRKEAVHPVQGWKDLHNRFGPHRRVYALVHPFLLDRPLVVIHVSLQATDIPNSMRAIHEAPPTEQPTVAAFYSISNLERGLAGIGLGEVLISETVNLLRGEFPCLQEFVTLSPMPHFRKWLKAKHPAFEHELTIQLDQSIDDEESTATESIVNERETRLHQLATQYIVDETTPDESYKPLDPVARFHLSNGAEVLRIVTQADLSTRGQQNSFGVMVNYRYDLSRRMERKARYAQNARDFDVAVANTR
ncbi:malonyl-CoA decarboxylase [Fistulifera solaris]|uniref:Malonyl-CoA decarboxylase n=1 Tax=Fistulifera solaris TaxID=1519565 RepID=A0A1Z5JYS4_FISSO|nr:malonyl-CoA decarboxylase [Fistulifera solaris]|eukprot:GAX19165.1 malonyl-CoA decarboxylase [Fistulifera solaris]